MFWSSILIFVDDLLRSVTCNVFMKQAHIFGINWRSKFFFWYKLILMICNDFVSNKIIKN